MTEREQRVREAAAVRDRDQAERAYSDRFGGFPHFLFMSAPDEMVVREVRRSILTGREIEPAVPGATY